MKNLKIHVYFPKTINFEDITTLVINWNPLKDSFVQQKSIDICHYSDLAILLKTER